MPKIYEHSCTSKVSKQLKKKDKRIYSIVFDCANIASWKGGELLSRNKTGQRIWVRYKYKKKNGDVIDKEVETFIGHNFCPFCGKKYKK